MYSQNIEHAGIYNNRDQLSVLEGHHLINRIVRYEEDKGLVVNDPQQGSVFHENVMDEQFPRKSIASEINLVSLYQVPKYDSETGKFVCAVNYYTSEPYEFTPFEKNLLQEHILKSRSSAKLRNCYPIPIFCCRNSCTTSWQRLRN